MSNRVPSSEFRTPSSELRTPMMCLVISLFSAIIGVGGDQVHAQARSVEDFNKLKPKWKSLASEKKQMTLEGRYGSASSTVLRFQKCALPFVFQTGKSFQKLSRKKRTIEVSGHLAFRENRLVFVVRTMRAIHSDLENFRLQKRAARRENVADWHRLGTWAKGRGEFYEDQELLDAALDAFHRGIQIEYRKLSADDAEGRMKLATKVAQYGLPESQRQELIHESYRIRWETLRARKQPNLNNLLAQIRRDLEGCETPLEKLQQELQKLYGKKPLNVYRETEVGARRVLHRMFYSSVLLKKIESTAESNGSNGIQIAAEIEKHLPEWNALAEQYRERELAYRFSRVESSDRSAVLELSKMFHRRKQPEKARETLTKWLSGRTREMRKDGPGGLMRIAEEYINLLDDESMAAKLLSEAYQLSPESEEISERLRRLGYVLKKGKWYSALEAAKIPEDPVEMAIREGRIIVGMTSSQVRRALGGKPASVTRIATAGEICELWVYGKRGTTRLVVYLRRSVRRHEAEAKVTAVSQSKPR